MEWRRLTHRRIDAPCCCLQSECPSYGLLSLARNTACARTLVLVNDVDCPQLEPRDGRGRILFANGHRLRVAQSAVCLHGGSLQCVQTLHSCALGTKLTHYSLQVTAKLEFIGCNGALSGCFA